MAKKAMLCPCLICKSGKCKICTSDSPHILEHKLIKHEMDVMSLNIINWRGLNGTWSNPGDALHTISSWFINQAHATTFELDITRAPVRADFPGWDHVGDHERIGHYYWNWFHSNHDGELYFSDSPDFYGFFRNGEKESHFFGDIGFVSAQAFAFTQKQMRLGDIWISVFPHKQVIIEPMVNLFEISHFEMETGKSYWDANEEELTLWRCPSQLPQRIEVSA